MATEVIGSVSINPIEVEYHLKMADFNYPYTREADFFRGWSKTPVIPFLYGLVAREQRFIGPEEGVNLLLCHVDEGCDPGDPMIIGRGQKLYMDFAREMHTMGLLQRCDLFGYIQYQKSLDMQFNVDYVAQILTLLGGGKIAIQSAMRKDWPDNAPDPYEQLKSQRRKRRGSIEWEGPLYWLTNKFRPPAMQIKRCWLFGTIHVKDLAEEIRGNHDNPGNVGIQIKLL